MLEVSKFEGSAGSRPRDRSEADLVRPVQVFSAVRRHWRSIVTCAAAGLLLGVIYLMLATPTFIATTLILLDPVANTVMEDEGGQLSSSFDGSDDYIVNSQVQIIQSGHVIDKIIEELGLMEDPRFVEDLEAEQVSSDGDESGQKLLHDLIAEFLLVNLFVERLDDTLVLAVTFQSQYPDVAVAVANKATEVYLDQQIDAKFEIARQLVSAMRERLQELREKMTASNTAITAFRRQHGLISAGETLLLEEQLVEASRSLMAAKADRSAAEARWEQMASVLEAGGALSALGLDVLDNQILGELRLKYLTFGKEFEESKAEFGEDHPQTERLAKELEGYKRLIQTELDRIVQSYESEYQVTLAREQKLEATIDELKETVADQRNRLLELEQLSSEAAVYREQYENILQRNQQALHQFSTLVSDARVISPAVEPRRPSHPRKSLLLALSLLAGLVLGASVVAYRELW